jgi:hypothetical protein
MGILRGYLLGEMIGGAGLSPTWLPALASASEELGRDEVQGLEDALQGLLLKALHIQHQPCICSQ